MGFLAPLLIGSLSPVAVVGSAFLAKTALSIVGSLLLSAAAKALAPKPKMPVTQSFGVRVSQRAALVPREMVYGRTRKGGTIIFMHTSGSGNSILDLVITVAAHRVQKIGAVYFDGVAAIADGATEASGRWAGRAQVWRALGDDDQAAFATSLGAFLPGFWTPSHRLRGVAAIHLRLTYDQSGGQDVWPTGLPNITFDVEGKNDIFDLRTATTGYTENPALCLADYMTHPIYGLGAVIGQEIDEADLIAAANVCDEAVSLTGGGSESRYRCNGIVSVDQTPQAIIQALLTAMNGTCAMASGQWHIHAGAYRLPTVAFTADDARPGGVRIVTRQSMAENFNAVRGTFVSPENDWQPDDFPAYTSSVYLAEDNGERSWKDIALPFTVSATMAQRLAKIELERQRRQIAVEFSGKLKCWEAKVGDTITLDYPRLGWTAKPFEVKAMRVELVEGQLLPVLTLRETSPLVYSWEASEAQIYAAAPRTTLPGPFDIDAPGITSAVEELYVTRQGDGVKALVRLAWSASVSRSVIAYEVEGRIGGGEWTLLGRTSALTFEALDVTPGAWSFRVRAESILGVRSAWAEISMQVFGLLGTPSPLAGVSLQSAGGLAVLKWDLHPDLDVRIGGQIVIRHSTSVAPTWATSVSVDEVAGGQTIGVVPLMPGAYILRARDSSGILGPASVVQTVGIQALPFLPIGTLQEDDEFSGARDNVALVGNTLQLSDSTLFSSHASIAALPSVGYPFGVVDGAGTYDFAASFDFGTVKTVRLRRDLDVSSIRVLDLVGRRVGNVSTWESFSGAVGAEGDVWVEVATTNDDPSGSPTWSDWQLVENDEVTARGVKARAILSTDEPNFTPRVSRLRLHADEVA